MIDQELATIIIGTFTALGVFLGFALGHKEKIDNPNINYMDDGEIGPIGIGFMGGIVFCVISMFVVVTFPWGILTVVTLTALYYLSKLFAKYLL